ncbi:flagellar basal body protein FliL [Comamonas testosteroni]|uniref:Flagellar protein FliL n=1 Tax=Comamonas testosteroni TaxID=285 RepID=A0A373FGE1_COMTE|nr:flagellar basal body-associated FliL family protein [Comamonas testosteroni]RGE43214.1 flagellar basal body protein FliL [Comamonas testosteroni]
MSANPNAAPAAPAPAKSKKLIVIVAVVAVLAIVAAAAYVFMMQRQHSSADGDEERSAQVTVPTFLPLDNMVANLADPGGDRFVQLGITLELADEKTASTVKQYLPSIRSGILMLVSQRTADELLAREGKEKLAADILAEVSAPLGYGNAKKRTRDDDAEEDSPRSSRKNPVRRVLFSSFIIQ